MPEYVMEFDVDENGKLINARRKEELLRCKDCAFCSIDKLFHMHWCGGRMVNPNGYCNERRRR